MILNKDEDEPPEYTEEVGAEVTTVGEDKIVSTPE
jgi:hypothetical protein